ncbi:MAG: competence/damage-inducible protein A [bacterium]
MIAEILTIGNEILQGRIDDTNATYISRRLTGSGIETKFRTTVSDTREAILSALEAAGARAGLVIVTGGLGPTVDDVTIETAAEYFGVELEHQPEIEEKIRRFYQMIRIPITESALRQARTPRGSEIITNPAGTAPGASYIFKGTHYMFFPGVPREMIAMLDSAIEMAIRSEEQKTIVSRSLRVFGIGESVAESKIPSTITTSANPTFSFLPQRFEVELRLTARGRNRDECIALIDPAVKEIYNRIGEYIYGEGDESLESAAYERLRERGLTVAFAESCTGGLLGGRFTAVPGASEVFRGGITAYSTDIKKEILGVPGETLDAHGPVSEATAKAMAERAASLFGADIGVSVTGNAGPTSGDGKSDVGQIYIGLARREPGSETICIGKKVMRHRNDVRDIAVSTALDFLRRNI